MEEFDRAIVIDCTRSILADFLNGLQSFLQRLGSVRGEDIPYIFGLPLVAGGAFFPRNYSRQDQGVAEAVLTFFTNFAKTGNPNEPHKIESVDYGTPKEKTRFRGLTWEQYETGSQQYLTIGESRGTRNFSPSLSLVFTPLFLDEFNFPQPRGKEEPRASAFPGCRDFFLNFPFRSLSSPLLSFFLSSRKSSFESDCVIVPGDSVCHVSLGAL